jgi:hypothetical protein
MKQRNQIKRIYVRRYRDNDQTTAYVEWSDGSRTEGSLAYSNHHRGPYTPSFGLHIHELFKAGKRLGLRLERETWGI